MRYMRYMRYIVKLFVALQKIAVVWSNWPRAECKQNDVM